MTEREKSRQPRIRPSNPTILATAARIVHRLLQHHGLDADALFIECRMDPFKLNDPRARYPLERWRMLWSVADKRISDRCWGLVGGELWRATDFHALGYAFLASRTLETALIRLERYFRIVIQDVALRVETDPDHCRITYATVPPDADIRPLQDTRWSVILRMCREVYGPDLRLSEVMITHPWEPCSYEQYFGCPVRYEVGHSGLIFPLEVVRQSLPATNRELAQENEKILSNLDSTLPDTSIVDRVRRTVMHGLSSGEVSAETVARSLALAPRTLQRKLRQEGTTFQEVTDTVRKELAMQYVLSGTYPLSEVMFLTGFATQSAFSRAYKGWTGHTPSEDFGRC
jgi:AraC-like DNA-binding protein